MSDESPIVSHVANQAYRDNWDATFGRRSRKDQDITPEHAYELQREARKQGKCGYWLCDPRTRIYLCEKPIGHQDDPNNSACSDCFDGVTWEWCDRAGPCKVDEGTP